MHCCLVTFKDSPKYQHCCLVAAETAAALGRLSSSTGAGNGAAATLPALLQNSYGVTGGLGWGFISKNDGKMVGVHGVLEISG